MSYSGGGAFQRRPGFVSTIADLKRRILALERRKLKTQLLVYDNGTLVGTEGGLDFEDSATVTWEVIDDPATGYVIIKADVVSGSGGGAGGFSGGAVGAVSSVSASTTRSSSSTSGPVSITPTTPTGMAAGDVILVVLNSYFNGGTGAGDISVAVPAGWGTVFNYQLIAQDDGGLAGKKSVRGVFWKYATGTEGAVLDAWTLTNAGGGGVLSYAIAHAFRGAAASGEIGAYLVRKTALTGSSFSSTAPAVQAPDGAISVVTMTCPAVPPSTTWTFPSGYSTAVIGAVGQFNTALSWVAPGTGAAESVSATGFSLGTAHRYVELAQIILYPAVT